MQFVIRAIDLKNKAIIIKNRLFIEVSILKYVPSIEQEIQNGY